MDRLEEIWLGLSAKLWSWLETLISMLPNLAVAIGVTLASLFVSRFVGRGVHRLMSKLTGNEPISSLLGTVGRLSTILVGLFFALGLLNLDKTVTSLLAGVGIVGLALGFAFQDIAASNSAKSRL
jgi:small conductance mechanosensitive channel